MSYFKSKDVRVFPCSYRGNYEKDNGSVTFDPEARLNTESNLISAGGKLGLKESYLIEKTDNVAKFVICGYYFEISNINSYDDQLSNKRLFVKLTDKPIKDDDGTDRARSTKVLGSWEDGSSGLDILKDDEYYFTGILIGDSATVGTGASGSLYISTEAAKLPSIDSGTGSKSIVIGKENVASGENSFAGGNNSEASRKNSVAFGDSAIADWENLVAIGKFNVTEENDLFVVGNGTSASRSNVLQVNANKVNINKETNIAGNVTVSGTEKVGSNFAIGENKFTVNSESGNTLVAGTLSAGATTINGTESVSGNFTVTDKFTVDSTTGNTVVAGTLGVSGKLTTGDSIETNKDINAAGVITTAGIKEDSKKVNISKNVNITGDEDENITGSLTVNSLTVNSDKLVVDNTKVYTSLPLEAKSFKTASLNVDELIINENENKDWTAIKIRKGTKKDKENENLTLIDANESKIVLESGMKSMLLNLFYPIGSIYTYLPNTDYNGTYPNISECPIAATLGGKWTQIKGRFLVAAGQDEDSGLNLNAGDTDGNKDAVAVSHTHNISIDGTTVTINENKNLSGQFYTGRGEYERWVHALGKDKGTGTSGIVTLHNGYEKDSEYYPDFNMQEIQLRPNQWHKPDKIRFNVNHDHTAESHTHTATIETSGNDGTDKNMPPYLVVYMWKRVE